MHRTREETKIPRECQL